MRDTACDIAHINANDCIHVLLSCPILCVCLEVRNAAVNPILDKAERLAPNNELSAGPQQLRGPELYSPFTGLHHRQFVVLLLGLLFLRLLLGLRFRGLLLENLPRRPLVVVGVLLTLLDHV